MIGGAKGIGIGLDFGIGNIKRPTKRDTLDPAIKEALCGVWIADQNTNESPTRNIIKNKISGKGGDFEILNAAYKLNSGYGIITTDFLADYAKDYGTNGEIELTPTSFIIKYNGRYSLIHKYGNPNSADIESYEVDVVISNPGLSANIIRYFYYDEQGNRNTFAIKESGRYTVPKNYVSKGTVSWVGWYVEPHVVCSIKQIVKYQGAFCTDGVDDLIVSQKSVSEMLGGSSELTVVSMIHQITANETNVSGSLNSNNKYFSNVTLKDKVTGIYGYSIKHIDDYYAILINNILGDKNNYNERSGTYLNSVPEFSVEGCRVSSKIEDVSQVAWYWTLIAKRVLTTDEINQVIAYYNLDKYVAPDIYYDVKKQGLTNDNHTEFGDKLIDYSGNGKDIQLYNFGWKLDSGVGKYETDFNDWVKYGNATSTQTKIRLPKDFKDSWIAYIPANKTIPTFKVKISGIPEGGFLQFISNSVLPSIILSNGENEIKGEDKTTVAWTGFNRGIDNLDWSNLVIEQIPSFEGALVFDGVDDYGQYVGDLGLKDYTVVADRAYVEIMNSQVPIISSMSRKTGTPFIIEHCPNELKMVDSFSFDKATRSQEELDIDRKISYQSTYVYNSNTITKGTSTNTGDGFTFGRFGGDAQYAKLCLYNFMLFPYSLSEFLIERQLKKRKLGTLYPVVKFNPIIEGNMPFEVLKYEKISETNAHLDLKIGDYVPIGQEICISIKLSDNTYKLSNVSSSSLTDINFGSPPNSPYASIYGKVTDKSPQDVTIHIENNQQGG